MPPKKDDKKAKGPAPGEVDPAAMVEAYKLQNTALQRHLAERSEKTLEAERITEELRNRIKQTEKEKSMTHADMVDITTEMNRQYKIMQENYKQQITNLENELQMVQEQLMMTQKELLSAKEETKQVIYQKDQEIRQLHEQMEDMSSEFGDMLTETIRKIADRIDISPEGYNGEGNVAKKMSEIASGTMVNK